MKFFLIRSLAGLALAATLVESGLAAEAEVQSARTVPDPVFPLQVSANGRHLMDQQGKPFLYQADTCWKLFLKLTEDEAGEYLRARKAQGFNTIQVMLTGFFEHGVAETNRAGEQPFLGDTDFAQPNEDFFAHIDRVVAKARELNLVLAIAPLWAGCCREGWAGQDAEGKLKPMNLNGPDKCRAFGRWLGWRYARFNNIVWILGGDSDPQESRDVMNALARGLKGGAPHHLMTYHASSSHSSSDVWPNERWVEVVMVYTYFRGFNKAWNKNQPDVYEVGYKEYRKSPPKPFYLGESTYEGEHGAWGSALQARKQAWWALLSGGTGHAYGSPNWRGPANWREVIELPGAGSLKHLPGLFHQFAWHTLVPDDENKLAVAGRGEFATNNYATTALAADGSFSISYLPSRRDLTLDLTRFSGPINASWYDPTNGRFVEITGSPIKNHGQRAFTPPDKNAAGDSDFVLVLQTAPRADASATVGR
jgi:hypothetical protein